MGQSFRFTCEKCHKESIIGVGIGFFVSDTYDDCLKEIKKGKFGREWKYLLSINENIVFNVDRKLYICESCRAWRCEEDLNLFLPKDPAKKPKDFNQYDVMSDDYEER
ncbi:MAG: hypothetical protein J6X38_03135, partial [Abditibacteriota bacterium]|nr:hypothetical protein [Abditibacteriota bacterium]